MPTMTIEMPSETYRRLQEQARRAGKAPEVLGRELLEAALRAQEQPRPGTVREVLQATGRIRPLSDALRAKIIPGVTLEEVRAALSRAAGPSLSELVQEQRGPKP